MLEKVFYTRDGIEVFYNLKITSCFLFYLGGGMCGVEDYFTVMPKFVI